MAKISAEEAFKRYQNGMAGAGEKIKYGVLNTDKSQSRNAIAAKEKMINNLNKALNNGDWEAGLKRAGDEKWSSNLISKGVGKIAQGIESNKTEIKEKMAKVVEVGDRVREECSKMPNNNIEDAISKVRMNIEIQRAAWGKN